MLWDGMDFFGFDIKKVQRLDGKTKVRCCDRFNNIEGAIMMMIYTTIFFVIVAFEGSLWYN